LAQIRLGNNRRAQLATKIDAAHAIVYAVIFILPIVIRNTKPRSGRITTHYSAAALANLIGASVMKITTVGLGFHPDQARRQVRKERQHFAALQLLAQYRFPPAISRVNLENALCQIAALPSASRRTD
jgi:hypothetical protein